MFLLFLKSICLTSHLGKGPTHPCKPFFGLFVRPFSGLEWHLLLKKYIANFASKERKSTKQNTWIYYEAVLSVMAKTWNGKKYPFSNVLFRQSLSLSFDKLGKLARGYTNGKKFQWHIWKWIIFAISRFSIIDETSSAALHFLKKSSNCTHFFYPPA